jgi:tRNA1Val (adenine37-N6)-methyltransferase
VGNNYFKFKQFTIVQEKSAMKVGTDGVLLGALAQGEGAEHILDIGTGTGLIAIMLAQRFSSKIDAVEIDEDAAKEATENANNSPWNNRINIFHTSFQDYSCIKKYDLIVSNPPFFTNSLKSPLTSKNHARHNDTLLIPALFLGVNKILSLNGTFQLIVPADDAKNYTESALPNNLFCNSILWIKPNILKPPKRVILNFQRTKKNLTESSLAIEETERHQYTNEYKILTSPFYL